MYTHTSVCVVIHECQRAYLRTIEFYSYFVCITCCIGWSRVDFVLDITEDEIRLDEMLRLV